MDPSQSSLPASPSDEMCADPVPDGYIRVIYKDSRQYPDMYAFEHMSEKGWSWRNTPEAGQHLVVRQKDGSRVEIPVIGILKLVVVPNGDLYCKWRDMENAATHVIDLENHLARANEIFDQRKEACAPWLATS